MFDVGKSFGISPVFYTYDRRWGFQRINSVYRLYGEDGEFVQEFRSMKAMCEYICRKDAEKNAQY